MTEADLCAAKNNDAPAPESVVDFDRLEALAASLTGVIHERAATWEQQFDAGPGDAVSVSDAAWVIAKHMLAEVSADTYQAAYDLVADACHGDMGPGGEALDVLIAAGWRPTAPTESWLLPNADHT